MNTHFKLLLLLLLISGPLLFSQKTVIYVSPDGDDRASGIGSEPLATLNGARDRIREIRKNGQPGDTIFVIIKDGRYFMHEPFKLEPRDGGSEKFPVVYKAEEGAKPIFSGGQKIKDIHLDENGHWVADIPEVRNRHWKFEQLYVNGRRAERAHSPDSGYFYMKKVSEHIWEQGTGRAPKSAQQVITVNPKDIQILDSLSENDLKKVVMTVYHKWDITKRHPDGITDSAQIITSGEGMKPWNRWQPGQRFKLGNFIDALTQPGEWFLETNGRLTYIPREGEHLKNAKIMAPVLSHLVIVKGEPDDGKYVENIHFEGLHFMYSANYLPPDGFEPAQAASTIDASFQVDGAKNIVLKDCEISHTGNYGVWFREACQDCRVDHCYIHDLGAGGIRLGTMKIPEDRKLVTRNIVLENNIIQSGGFVFPPAVGVWIGQSSDNTVSHNDIGDFRYTGVSVGWVWGYSYSPARRNHIIYNHIHHLGWGVLSDLGGVYTLGTSEGTVVSNNVIDHIWSYSYGGWGLYPDEGTSHITMENNLVYKTKTGGFHQHYGKENIIRNNIFAFAADYQLQCTRVEPHLSFSFTRNIVVFDTGVLLSGPWAKINVEMDDNIYWNTTGNKFDFVGKNFSLWKKAGRDIHSILTDPGFIQSQRFNFYFKNNKTIRKTGFTPFDYSKAGIYGCDSWEEKAKLPSAVTLKFDSIMERK